jgi:hypothetical protein
MSDIGGCSERNLDTSLVNNKLIGSFATLCGSLSVLIVDDHDRNVSNVAFGFVEYIFWAHGLWRCNGEHY